MGCTKSPAKPCSRCIGAELTVANSRHYEFCAFHLGEVMREIRRLTPPNPTPQAEGMR